MECGVWWSVKCGGRGVTGTEPVPFFPKRHVFFREPRAEEWSGGVERRAGGRRRREREGKSRREGQAGTTQRLWWVFVLLLWFGERCAPVCFACDEG